MGRRYYAMIARVVALTLVWSQLALAAEPPKQTPPRLVVQLGQTTQTSVLCVAPNGKWLLSGGEDGQAILWDYATMRELRRFQRAENWLPPSGRVIDAYFSSDSRRLAVHFHYTLNNFLINEWLGILVWDVASGQELVSLGNTEADVLAARMSPDGGLVAIRRPDESLHLWDVATGQELPQFGGVKAGVVDLEFSADSKLLAAPCRDTTALIWDVATGQEVRRFGEPREWDIEQARRIRFAPLPGHFVVWGGGERPQLWSQRESKVILSLKQPAQYYDEFVFSPNEKLVARSGSNTQVWKIPGGEPVYEFRHPALRRPRHPTSRPQHPLAGLRVSSPGGIRVCVWRRVGDRQPRHRPRAATDVD